MRNNPPVDEWIPLNEEEISYKPEERGLNRRNAVCAGCKMALLSLLAANFPVPDEPEPEILVAYNDVIITPENASELLIDAIHECFKHCNARMLAPIVDSIIAGNVSEENIERKISEITNRSASSAMFAVLKSISRDEKLLCESLQYMRWAAGGSKAVPLVVLNTKKAASDISIPPSTYFQRRFILNLFPTIEERLRDPTIHANVLKTIIQISQIHEEKTVTRLAMH